MKINIPVGARGTLFQEATMKKIDEILKDDHIVEVIQKGVDGAAFNVKINYRLYNVIASNGGGLGSRLY